MREQREMVEGLDANQFRELCAEEDIPWMFITPAVQHQIGYAESLVNSCIAALKQVIADEVLTPLELYTCFLEIANLINQRSISSAPDDPEDGSYCYALMTCSSIEPHPKCLKDTTNPTLTSR